MSTVVSHRILVSPEGLAQASELAAHGDLHVGLQTQSGKSVPLSPELQDVLGEALRALGQHGSVSISQAPERLTSTMAAHLLGVSRPTLLKWAREGRIPSFAVGTHTRFLRSDVAALRDELEHERRLAFDKLRALDAENGFQFEDAE